MLQVNDPKILRPDVTVTELREDVPRLRERFAVAASSQDLERRAWKKSVDSIHINTNVIINGVARFNQMLDNVAAEIEGDCLIIPAPSGAGKSHLLARLQKNSLLAPFSDETGPVRPLVFIKAPSPCTLKTLGLSLYKSMTGDDLSANLREHDIWSRVVSQMHAQLVSVLIIDEFHHTLRGRTSDERRTLVETLKNLVIPNPEDPLLSPGAVTRPICLVLSGMPWLRQVLKEDFQLVRRRAVVSIKPLDHTGPGVKKAEKFLSLVEPKLGFPDPSGLSDPDMVQRMLKASSGYTGRMMHLIKKAAFRAIDQGAPCIDQTKHLAFVFEEIFEVGARRNPFLVPNISICPKIKEAEFDTLTRLVGMGEDKTPADDVS
ncbi:ATP-binding protein [Methylobacterium sp.]|uniref:ATP-binding protein n=1 Tax=Methylobacterium sp. TaxID=409 RepID=UPI0025CF5923|nr:ATP-binding protein [Methylobacterium sp.]MBY0256993.1 ATP-binding protein [Methylobacterium sp.]